MTNNNRMGRIDSEIQKALADTFTYNINSKELEGVMVSVISCHTSKDLKHCKVLISIFPDNDKEKKFFAVKNTTPYLRRELARRINLRVVPELSFELDNSAEYGANIDRIIASLHNENNGEIDG